MVYVFLNKFYCGLRHRIFFTQLARMAAAWLGGVPDSLAGSPVFLIIVQPAPHIKKLHGQPVQTCVIESVDMDTSLFIYEGTVHEFFHRVSWSRKIESPSEVQDILKDVWNSAAVDSTIVAWVRINMCVCPYRDQGCLAWQWVQNSWYDADMTRQLDGNTQAFNQTTSRLERYHQRTTVATPQLWRVDYDVGDMRFCGSVKTDETTRQDIYREFVRQFPVAFEPLISKCLVSTGIFRQEGRAERGS